MMKHIFHLLLIAFMLSGCSGGSSKLGGDTQTDPAAPTLTAIGDKTVIAGNGLSFTLAASDPNDSALTYSTDGTVGVGNPYDVTSTNNATFDASTATFNWTPTSDDVGIYTVKFTVTNEAGKSATETITITVTSTSIIAGQTLFSSNCTGSACHNTSYFDNITVTEKLISDNITANTGGMGILSGLTTSEREDIANYLQSLK